LSFTAPGHRFHGCRGDEKTQGDPHSDDEVFGEEYLPTGHGDFKQEMNRPIAHFAGEEIQGKNHGHDDHLH